MVRGGEISWTCKHAFRYLYFIIDFIFSLFLFYLPQKTIYLPPESVGGGELRTATATYFCRC